MQKQSQGQRLRQIIKIKGFLVKDVAATLGFKARESLTRYFNEDVLPEHLIVRVAEILKISPDEIKGDIMVNEDTGEYEADIMHEIDRLKAENQELKAKIYDLLKKVGGFNL